MVIVQKTLTFTYSNPPGTLVQYSISSTKSVRKPSDLKPPGARASIGRLADHPEYDIITLFTNRLHRVYSKVK